MAVIAFLLFACFTAISLGQDHAHIRVRRLVNGYETAITKYPYVAVIWRINSDGSHEAMCSGVIIRRKHLITTAHCVSFPGPKSFLITADSEKTNGQGGSLSYVANITIHPDFHPINLKNNIAVVKTTRDLLTDVNKLAVLAPHTYVTKDNSQVSVAGFGAQGIDGPNAPKLREVFSSVVNKEVCKSYYIDNIVKDGMFCFGGATSNNRPGSCNGDHGSPVVNDKNVVVGLVSVIRGCGTVNPEVATAIAPHANWIVATAV